LEKRYRYEFFSIRGFCEALLGWRWKSDVRMNISTQSTGSFRGFWSLIITQFQGAFSDNALKQIAIFIGISIGISQVQRDQLVSVATALLTLPFILFSMAGGYLANHWSKRTVIIGVKVFEIGVMGLAMIGLAMRNVPMMLACVFLMGVHSSIFGQSKYGSLPELLPEAKLSWGNGILELGTFLAIIFGTVAGGVLAQVFEGRPAWAGAVLVALAVMEFIPSQIRVGKETSVPPPATELIAPATKADANAAAAVKTVNGVTNFQLTRSAGSARRRLCGLFCNRNA